MAGNCEAGGFVNSAVKGIPVFSMSPICNILIYCLIWSKIKEKECSLLMRIRTTHSIWNKLVRYSQNINESLHKGQHDIQFF